MHAAAAILLAAALAFAPCDSQESADTRDSGAGSVPILYSTDLFHPHGDPDDHFDLATLFAVAELDIRGVVLDVGARQTKAPGRIPVTQMIHLTGRKVPFAVGLKEPLKSPSDDGRDQPGEYQDGVELLLDGLRRAQRPITVFTTGSLRDVAAAWNRRPELLKQKIARLYVNIGDSSGGDEHNVGLDRHSYVRVMRSGLPVWWCPCFDGGVWKREQGYATYWRFRHEDVLESTPEPLQNWFIYALTRSRSDPLDFLSQAQNPDVRRRVWAMARNMWCTGPFLDAAGKTVVEVEPGQWQVVPLAEAEGKNRLFHFVPGEVSVEDGGRVALLPGKVGKGHRVQVFKIHDVAAYDRAMTHVLRDLYAALKLHPTAVKK